LLASNDGSERASNVEDYQRTCAEFLVDISSDYKNWVERYKLDETETCTRMNGIDSIVKTTNEWIFEYADTIKKVDIVMNDGINKMAENTAGYPFDFDVLVNSVSRYTKHTLGEVKMNIRVAPREGRLARLGRYYKDQLLLLNSVSPVNFTITSESLKGADIMNDYIVIDAKDCRINDLLAVTVIAEEFEGDYVTESRGYSTLVLLI
jgi:hypothetical protein